ncbi:MAG: flagellar biosynthesis protein FlhB [Phycisphaeraceae bacterium]|nr:flagellar biosynthesis protein FlhB [Phycisphaeraceae bacterium]
MAGEDMGEKTERPTAKRLSDARSKGSVARSQDLSAAIVLIAGVSLLLLFGASLVRDLSTIMSRVLEGRTPGNPHDIASAGQAMRWAGMTAASAVAPIFLLIALIAFIAGSGQVKWLVTTHPIKPNLSRLNPVGGLKRIFGLKGLAKSGVNFFKLALVAAVSWWTLARFAPRLASLPRMEATSSLTMVGRMLIELAVWLLLILLLLAIVDFIYQRWQHMRDMRMTKHEVKDERRSMEGDPETKKRRLRMAMDIARHRVGQAVPKADVVVTNPTHYSVALRYDEHSMRAPRVVAKGVDHLALLIRQIAIANAVPLVERPPLARAMYFGIEVGQEIPPSMYEAVAEILAFVYRTEAAAA